MVKKILPTLQKVEDTVLVVTFVVMVLSFFMQVVNRNIIKASVSWFEELSRYCMMYMAFLAAEAGLRDGTQISVTAVTEALPQKVGDVLLILSRIIVVVFAVIVFVTSISLLKLQVRSGQLSPALKLPMTIPYFALTFSFGIICFTQTTKVILMIVDYIKNFIGDSRKEAA